MSKPSGKPRFGALGELSKPAPAAAAPAPQEEDKLEPFSTTLYGKTKVLLKKAAADERRKQYELLEEAIAEYLARKHPNLK
ncbi:hypothetical protein [Deinococcus xianganensis]|uniref:CopG family transcriptional regulator n=1 Tax=Deinococcus xianganensis TaxID=1507289 RepID=A0A6I4YHQ3_9DEIO|nr:hypothetical protein [Deinococcus xianganensis]MXV21919.1 hypothetical protein [Deinococcus xianganensis]